MAENTEQYVPGGAEMEELIAGLMADSGDYGRQGQAPAGALLSWDQRNVRAWEAARILSGLTAHDARVRAEARSDALREAAGLWHGFDLNPTVMPGMNDDIWWTMHLQRLDSTWRRHLTGMAERAQEARR